MLIAYIESDFGWFQSGIPAIDFVWTLLIFVFLVATIPAVIMMYFVIWSRKDWMLEARIAATIAATLSASFGLLLPIAVPFYGIVDVATRHKITGKVKARWIAAIVLVPGIGVFIYFMWALRRDNRPQAPKDQEPTTAGKSGTLTSGDLDHAQKLTDLRIQGTLTDEQYEQQRQHVMGQTGRT